VNVVSNEQVSNELVSIVCTPLKRSARYNDHNIRLGSVLPPSAV